MFKKLIFVFFIVPNCFAAFVNDIPGQLSNEELAYSESLVKEYENQKDKSLDTFIWEKFSDFKTWMKSDLGLSDVIYLNEQEEAEFKNNPNESKENEIKFLKTTYSLDEKDFELLRKFENLQLEEQQLGRKLEKAGLVSGGDEALRKKHLKKGRKDPRKSKEELIRDLIEVKVLESVTIKNVRIHLGKTENDFLNRIYKYRADKEVNEFNEMNKIRRENNKKWVFSLPSG